MNVFLVLAFTPMRNITCAQCQMQERPELDVDLIKWRISRLQCLERPELFFTACPSGEYRGCGKTIMYTNEPQFVGTMRS
ncbi:unnamed protein product [Protopolystoma xenopodis]|uniref:Uncharacterized protein n=1 Tax=Protopolystoma xenopodis TaxID=117903 RepID=A0A3S5FFK7_9PLAT|nr:unnamed protein product [Protopolystoma xenopodis]